MKLKYSYNHYFKHDEITEILQEFALQYPKLCRLTSLNKTEEGRDIWLMEITDLSFGAFEEKPAYVSAGNIHAGEVTGSMNVMYLIDTLLTGYEENVEIRNILRDYTIYAIPRISPDGSEFYLTRRRRCRRAFTEKMWTATAPYGRCESKIRWGLGKSVLQSRD